jgi:hypothetical protein
MKSGSWFFGGAPLRPSQEKNGDGESAMRRRPSAGNSKLPRCEIEELKALFKVLLDLVQLTGSREDAQMRPAVSTLMSSRQVRETQLRQGRWITVLYLLTNHIIPGLPEAERAQRKSEKKHGRAARHMRVWPLRQISPAAMMPVTGPHHCLCLLGPCIAPRLEAVPSWLPCE